MQEPSICASLPRHFSDLPRLFSGRWKGIATPQTQHLVIQTNQFELQIENLIFFKVLGINKKKQVNVKDIEAPEQYIRI